MYSCEDHINNVLLCSHHRALKFRYFVKQHEENVYPDVKESSPDSYPS
jgi:hypothetical protein